MDGVSSAEDYINFCKENGLEACSCTDHGYVLGLYDLITKSKEKGVKGIPGIEAYLAPHEEYEYSSGKRPFDYFHLTLWASGQDGYKNLLSLSSASWGPGRVVHRFGQPKPRITWDDLEIFGDGLFCGSGCIEGPIVKPFLRGEKKMAIYGFQRLIDIFGDRLYMEVMPHAVDRDWKTRGLVQVTGENGIEYTFLETDILDTDIGQITAKEAFDKKVSEIYGTITKRMGEKPMSTRTVEDPLLL